jgi:hypothetical protein
MWPQGMLQPLRENCFQGPDFEVRTPLRPLIYGLRNQRDTDKLIELAWLWF